MNTKQIEKYFEKHFGDEFKYNAPEVYEYKLERMGHLKGNHLAVMVLWNGKKCFQKRINGEINDNWLSKETFSDIYDNIISVLEEIDNKDEFQLKLLEKFQSFAN